MLIVSILLLSGYGEAPGHGVRDSPFESDLTYSIVAVIDANTKPGWGYLFAALAVLTGAAILFVSDVWLKCVSRGDRTNPNIKSHNRGCPRRRVFDENDIDKAQGMQYCRQIFGLAFPFETSEKFQRIKNQD